MKKVEVYFLINLGAILSLFAIEGELAVYMSRQNDILKNVAQDKLQDLVEISNVESNYDDPDYYRLFFDVDGQYEKGSIEFNPSFTTSIVEVEGDEIIQAICSRGDCTTKQKVCQDPYERAWTKQRYHKRYL